MNKSFKITSFSVGKERGPLEGTIQIDSHSEICVLADGLGGKERGDLAAQLAGEFITRFVDSQSIETQSTWLFEKREDLSLEENFLRMALLYAHGKIVARAQQEEKMGWMGCSVLAALSHDDKLILSGVGNCRAYLFRKDSLTQLTQDNSLAKFKGLAPLSRLQNIPLNFLGKAPQIDIDTSVEKVTKPHDLYLLLSPGITNALSPQTLLEIIQSHQTKTGDIAKTIALQSATENPTQDHRVIVLQKLESH